MNRGRILGLLASTAAVLDARAAKSQVTVPLRVATFPSENGAEPYFARDLGLFAKAGLDVTIATTQGDSATIAAIASNAMDIGYVSVGTLAAAHAKGLPLAVIAPASEYSAPETSGIAAIMLPANSTVHSAKDLNGKTFAVSTLGSIAVAGARGWIDQNGGDSSTVKFIEVPLSAETAALNTGRFDAAWITEPFLGGAKKVGRVLTYGYDGIAKHFVIGVWFTTTQWAKEHAGVAQRYAEVMRETAQWANKNHEKSGEILAKYSKIDPQVLATMARSRYADRISPELMQPFIDMFARYNGFKTFPASELLFTGA